MSSLALRLSSDSDGSGSSHGGSGLPSPPVGSICQWRTHRFYDQECQRFFDCPTHIVERCSSTNGREEEGEEDGIPVAGPSHRAPEPRPDDNDDGAMRQATGHQIPGEPAQHAGSNSLEGTNLDSTEAINPFRITLGASSSTPSTPSTLRPEAPVFNPSQGAPPNLLIPQQEPLSSSSHAYPPPRSQLPALTRLEDLIAHISATSGSSAPGGSNMTVPQRPFFHQNPSRQTPVPNPMVLPRWQPDREVTFCPICRTQFSIFVRKHHCRKCGRVVCNSCSPHRIVIPYQFIVTPYCQPRPYDPDQAHGGGERVRLCNPCVPDPNTTPPRTNQGQGPTTNLPSPYSHTHHRSNSSSQPYNPPNPRSPIRLSPHSILQNRNRSATVGASQLQHPRGYIPPHSQQQPRPRVNRIISGTPPVGPWNAEFLHASARYPVGHPRQGIEGYATIPTTPPLSQEISEDDECPICHRELPSRQLPNFEALRESHINMCVQAHSNYSGGGSSSAAAAGPGDQGTSPHGSGEGGKMMRRPTGMFPYTATEKDCVDSAECTICLEEFEAGAAMARLECLCRFHRGCILAWWKGHPGRCPVHQHDDFGF